MKVLVGPRADLVSDTLAARVARALAGAEGMVVSLGGVGVKNLARPLTAAEVALVRAELAGEETVVGYVCRGRVLDSRAAKPDAVVATDHANLTWRSPLTGPNDETIGPRFPGMTGVYEPGTALDALSTLDGMIVVSGVVAGVSDDCCLSDFEAGTATTHRHAAVSSELVPVVILAAHLGLRVAAVVVTAEGRNKGER